MNYEKVPNIITGKDLDYLSDMFNWNYGALKSNLNAINEVKAVAEYTNTPYLEPNTSEQYTVQRGDTLYSISKKFNISINKIKELNNLESNTILPGQILIIKEQTTPPQPTTYKVQKGDTLYSISQQFNTTVDEIKKLNNITSNNIYINQELYIPLFLLRLRFHTLFFIKNTLAQSYIIRRNFH